MDECLSLVRELRALERLDAGIRLAGARSFEWRCGLTALDDRLRWLRYCVSLEHPMMVATVEDLLTAEAIQPSAPGRAEAPVGIEAPFTATPIRTVH